MELLHGLQVRVREYDGLFYVEVLDEIPALVFFKWTLLPAKSKWRVADTKGHVYMGTIDDSPMQPFGSLEDATAKIRALQRGVVYHTVLEGKKKE